MFKKLLQRDNNNQVLVSIGVRKGQVGAWLAPRDTITLPPRETTRAHFGGEKILGSLSNNNGDGNENVISKYKFALF